ncbi:hypothetical protein MMC18_000366 [Xylographa bjoerkii]|nr:hypothetical protein [Xylographa bjoerkii]
METALTEVPVDAVFTRALPKIELHAHLTGSITRQCLHEIWETTKDKDPTFTLEDPLVVLPPGKVDFDVNTFFPLFSQYIYGLCNTRASVIHSTIAVLRDFQSDGVVYLELRTTPRSCHDLSKNGYVLTVLDCIQNFKSSSSTMSTNLILSIDRKDTAHQAMETVDLAIRHKSRGVVGIDLCGNPAKGDVSIYGAAFSKAKAHDLRLTLHFAEVPASSSETELWTLLSYEPQRLGHVINVPEDIKNEIMKRKVGLELCLTCNVNAKLISGGFADHHFRYWKDKGCPLVICTDDVGIFCSPLSNEYLLLAENFELSRKELAELSLGATDVIFGSVEEKQRLRGLLDPFCK